MTNYQQRNARKWMAYCKDMTPDQICEFMAFLIALFSYRLQQEER